MQHEVIWPNLFLAGAIACAVLLLAAKAAQVLHGVQRRSSGSATRRVTCRVLLAAFALVTALLIPAW